MFNFLGMMDDYDERKVDRYEQDEIIISTAKVTDGAHPFETAVSHPSYHGGDWVIVEAYDTKENAQQGHARWVTTMTSDPLPDKLVDCSNAGISQLGEIFGMDMEFPKE